MDPPSNAWLQTPSEQTWFAVGAPRTPAAPFSAVHFLSKAPWTTTAGGVGSSVGAGVGVGSTTGDVGSRGGLRSRSQCRCSRSSGAVRSRYRGGRGGPGRRRRCGRRGRRAGWRRCNRRILGEGRPGRQRPGRQTQDHRRDGERASFSWGILYGDDWRAGTVAVIGLGEVRRGNVSRLAGRNGFGDECVPCNRRARRDADRHGKHFVLVAAVDEGPLEGPRPVGCRGAVVLPQGVGRVQRRGNIGRLRGTRRR